MKKIVSFLFLLFATLSASAQLRLSDLLPELAKPSETDSLIIRAVEPGLYLVRQQYQLQDKAKGTFHGKNGEDFFGESYSLGVKVAGGLLITREVLFPWVGDGDFEKVNNHGAYVPRLFSTTLLRGLSASTYRETNLDLNVPEYLLPLGPDSLVLRHVEAQSDFGFIADEDFGAGRGYMIWAVADSVDFHADMKVKLVVKNYGLPTGVDTTFVACEPEDSLRAIGGVFITPVVDHVGQITFHLAGICVPTAEGDWVLRSLSAPRKEPATEEKTTRRGRRHQSSAKDKTTADDEDSGVNLTPIEKK